MWFAILLICFFQELDAVDFLLTRVPLEIRHTQAVHLHPTKFPLMQIVTENTNMLPTKKNPQKPRQKKVITHDCGFLHYLGLYDVNHFNGRIRTFNLLISHDKNMPKSKILFNVFHSFWLNFYDFSHNSIMWDRYRTQRRTYQLIRRRSQRSHE